MSNPDINVEVISLKSDVTNETVSYSEFGIDAIIFDDCKGEEWNKALRLALAGGHSRMADFIACVNETNTCNGCRFVFAEGQRRWYYWNGTRWKQQKGTHIVKEFIRSEEVWGPIANALEVYRSHVVDRKEKKAAQIQRTLERLEDNGYKSSVLMELEVVCRRAPGCFEDLLDKDRTLLAFENCILDLSTGELREGRRDDYVSGSVGYQYEHNVDEALKTKWAKVVSEIFPDESVREYAQKAFGVALSVVTKDQLVHFLNGLGQNGKGLILKALGAALGSFATSLPAGFLTDATPDANNPTPALTSAVNARAVIMSEMEEGKKLNQQTFKACCGEDVLPYRKMREELSNFTPLFKIYVATNPSKIQSG
jgi:putative DNA primase/helicase